MKDKHIRKTVIVPKHIYLFVTGGSIAYNKCWNPSEVTIHVQVQLLAYLL